MQTANRAIGQVGVGCENALLDHIKRTIVRLLCAQQLILFQLLELSEFPNFYWLVSDGGVVDDRLQQLC